MGRHQGERRGPGRSVHVLGTACGTLAVAAVVTAVQPVPRPVLTSGGAPAVGQGGLYALGDAWAPVDESEPAGGPLEIPEIGVVLEDYDERYAALVAARVAERALVDDDVSAPPPPSPVEALPAPPETPPADEPPVAQPPSTPPTPPTVPALTTTPAMPWTPSPTTPPQSPTPPSPTPPSPTTTPPAEKPPTEEPSTPPSPTPPSPTTTPPAEKPPTEEPSTPPPPADTTLALGQRYEYADADGNVELTITLVSVAVDQACTAAGSLPAENGHLIGLHLEVVDPDPPAAGEPPSISAADFRFRDADDVLAADVDTAASAACLEDGWPADQPSSDGPVEGRIVLDIATVTGTIVYRPEGRSAGLRWEVPAVQ